MLDKLFALFKTIPLSHMSGICSAIHFMMDLFAKEFSEDKDARNAAIDSVIEILNSYKDKS